MSDAATYALIFITIPLIAVWAITMADILAQPRLAVAWKLVWVVGCTFVLPVLMIYWITRPIQGRAERAEDRSGPQARLVDAALDHEDGRIDDAEMAAIVAELRRG